MVAEAKPCGRQRELESTLNEAGVLKVFCNIRPLQAVLGSVRSAVDNDLHRDGSRTGSMVDGPAEKPNDIPHGKPRWCVDAIKRL